MITKTVKCFRASFRAGALICQIINIQLFVAASNLNFEDKDKQEKYQIISFEEIQSEVSELKVILFLCNSLALAYFFYLNELACLKLHNICSYNFLLYKTIYACNTTYFLLYW